jgi:hypothetical protein
MKILLREPGQAAFLNPSGNRFDPFFSYPLNSFPVGPKVGISDTGCGSDMDDRLA